MDEDEIPAKLDAKHQGLLQAFMARRVMSTDEVIETWTRLSGREDAVSRLEAEAAIAECNIQLINFDLEIRPIRDQKNGHELFAFINTVSDDPMQLGTLHNPDEIKFIRVMLEEMFDKNNEVESAEIMAITATQAVNLKSRQKDEIKLSAKEINSLLDDLVANGWLRLSENKYYNLTPRAVAELQPYLLETFNGDEEDKIHTCNQCSNIVVIGDRCSNQECNVYLHRYCQRAVENGMPCPKCRRAWSNVLHVGEEAAVEG
jgi:hypothetical protein